MLFNQSHQYKNSSVANAALAASFVATSVSYVGGWTAAGTSELLPCDAKRRSEEGFEGLIGAGSCDPDDTGGVGREVS